MATKVYQGKFDLSFQGPVFLYKERSNWPNCEDLGPADTNELKSHVLFMTEHNLSDDIMNVVYFSSWKKVLRVYREAKGENKVKNYI